MLELYVDKGCFVNAIVLRLQTFYTTNTLIPQHYYKIFFLST